MLLTGPGGVSVRGGYGGGIAGRVDHARVFDHWLIAARHRAGAQVEEDTLVISDVGDRRWPRRGRAVAGATAAR